MIVKLCVINYLKLGSVNAKELLDDETSFFSFPEMSVYQIHPEYDTKMSEELT